MSYMSWRQTITGTTRLCEKNFVFVAHQQILNQTLDIFGSLRRWRIVRCQLDEGSQEIFTLLHILLHFLWLIKKKKTIINSLALLMD